MELADRRWAKDSELSEIELANDATSYRALNRASS